MTSSQTVRKNLISIGDSDCGKTCLLMVFAGNEFPKKYIPNVFDHFTSDIQIGDGSVELRLSDTAAQETYDSLRRLQYQGINVILICFSVVSRNSFDHVLLKWVPEVRRFCPNAPVLLVETKTDLRNDNESIENVREVEDLVVKESEGHALAKKIGAIGYVECSAKTGHNVENVFRLAAEVALNKGTKKRKRKCILL